MLSFCIPSTSRTKESDSQSHRSVPCILSNHSRTSHCLLSQLTMACGVVAIGGIVKPDPLRDKIGCLVPKRRARTGSREGGGGKGGGGGDGGDVGCRR